jgi:hypothetical protein
MHGRPNNRTVTSKLPATCGTFMRIACRPPANRVPPGALRRPLAKWKKEPLTAPMANAVPASLMMWFGHGAVAVRDSTVVAV